MGRSPKAVRCMTLAVCICHVRSCCIVGYILPAPLLYDIGRCWVWLCLCGVSKFSKVKIAPRHTPGGHEGTLVHKASVVLLHSPPAQLANARLKY
eukprot:6467820-Amphidinium_carterae.2